MTREPQAAPSPATAGRSAGTPAREHTASENSIAVTPFADMSAARDQEFFCEGRRIARWEVGKLITQTGTQPGPASFAEWREFFVPLLLDGATDYGGVVRSLSEPVFHEWIGYLMEVNSVISVGTAVDLDHFYYRRLERAGERALRAQA